MTALPLVLSFSKAVWLSVDENFDPWMANAGVAIRVKAKVAMMDSNFIEMHLLSGLMTRSEADKQSAAITKLRLICTGCSDRYHVNGS